MPGHFGRKRGKDNSQPTDGGASVIGGEMPGQASAQLASVGEYAALIGLTEAEVLGRLRDGRLIAVAHSDSPQKRSISIFQPCPEITGSPLAQIASALRIQARVRQDDQRRVQAYQFLTEAHEFAGGLSPLQVLAGAGRHDGNPEEKAFLAKPFQERLAYILVLAKNTAARHGRVDS